MNPTRPPKLIYKLAKGGRVTVDLTFDAESDLMEIQKTLQRESDSPTVPVSKASAMRRALEVYAMSLRRNAGRLQSESSRAAVTTYIDKRKART